MKAWAALDDAEAQVNDRLLAISPRSSTASTLTPPSRRSANGTQVSTATDRLGARRRRRPGLDDRRRPRSRSGRSVTTSRRRTCRSASRRTIRHRAPTSSRSSKPRGSGDVADRARAQVDVRSLAARVVHRASSSRSRSPTRSGRRSTRLVPAATSLPFVASSWCCACIRFVLNYVSRNYLLKTAYRIEYDLRNIIYEHLSRMSFSFYDRVQSGQLISRGNSDIRAVQMYLSHRAVILVQCSVAVLAFAQMLPINVPLAFVTMSTMPFVLHRRRPDAPADVPGVVADPVAAGRGRHRRRREHQRRAGGQVVRGGGAPAATPHRRRASGPSGPTSRTPTSGPTGRRCIENLPRLGQALVLLYGGYLAINGQATVGDIAAFNAYVLMLQPPFRQLGMVMMMGQRAAASAQRIYEVLDEQPDVVDRPGRRRPRRVPRRRALRRRRRSTTPTAPRCSTTSTSTCAPARRSRSSAAPAAGKSTAARLLARFYDVTGGAVRVDGHDVRDLTLPSLRHHIGMVLDEPFLFSVSIRDNIAYGRPDAPFDEVEAAARAAGADEFIRELPEGYDTVVGERGFTLSGGQRQRISIARTLLVNPPILVLDDATSAIDVQVEQQIHVALERAHDRPHDAHHRPPPVDDQPRRPGRGGRGRPGHRRGHARRAAGHRAALRRDPGPEPRRTRAADVEREARRGSDEGRRLLGTRSTTTSPTAALDDDVGDSPTRPSSRTRQGSSDGVGWRRLAAVRRRWPVGRRLAGQPGQRAAVRGHPREMQAGVEKLLADEPDLAGARRAVLPPDAETGVSLRRMLRPHRRMMIGLACPRRDRGPLRPGRPVPQPDRHRRRHHAATTGPSLITVAVAAILAVVIIRDRRAAARVALTGRVAVAGDVRAPRAHVRPPATPVARLLHRREGGRDHDPHDERHRGAPAAAAGRPRPVRACRGSRCSSSRSCCSRQRRARADHAAC